MIRTEPVKLDIFTFGETSRPAGISRVPEVEPRVARSATLVDGGNKPECLRI